MALPWLIGGAIVAGIAALASDSKEEKAKKALKKELESDIKKLEDKKERKEDELAEQGVYINSKFNGGSLISLFNFSNNFTSQKLTNLKNEIQVLDFKLEFLSELSEFLQELQTLEIYEIDEDDVEEQRLLVSKIKELSEDGWRDLISEIKEQEV